MLELAADKIDILCETSVPHLDGQPVEHNDDESQDEHRTGPRPAWLVKLADVIEAALVLWKTARVVVVRATALCQRAVMRNELPSVVQPNMYDATSTVAADADQSTQCYEEADLDQCKGRLDAGPYEFLRPLPQRCGRRETGRAPQRCEELDPAARFERRRRCPRCADLRLAAPAVHRAEAVLAEALAEEAVRRAVLGVARKQRAES
mmetsp:Transcript_87761/g.248651  ORF Transcript_87761/g.248651 Transcript_87761/m.248651 type:complete len:207 (-) Transcript_87761:147-767(-)